MEYGLIGAKLGHSYSPAIHARLGDYDYQLYERTEAEFIDLMARRAFKGLNVTIPYKKVAYAHSDVLSDVALEVGCVNTLVVRPDGTLYGHNTDIGGLIASIRRAGIQLAGRKAAILGSGGTSLTARAACRRLGAAETVVISRSGPVDYAALYRDHADVAVVINATPVGMYPNVGVSPVDLSRLPKVEGVVDVIYNPNKPALLLDAEARGIPTANGMFMLVAQARETAELFLNKSIDPSVDEAIYAAMRAEALNLILVGMPGSGKTTVGAALAEALGRPFVDCDGEIVRRAGRSIPEIFEKDGEAAFREMEAGIVAEVCREKGQVIATGGGAVLRDDNVRAMRQNGVVLMLERRLDALSMDGRPLSVSPEALADMWAAREPRYRAAMDAAVDNNGALADTLRRAEEAFHEAVDR